MGDNFFIIELNEEKKERILGDNQNRVRISNEEANRAESVSNLAVKHFQEVSDRAEEISLLKNRINILESNLNQKSNSQTSKSDSQPLKSYSVADTITTTVKVAEEVVAEEGIGGVGELVIGEEKVDPGIVFIFEAAVEDHINPHDLHLKSDATDVHIEARVNWDPEGKTVEEGGELPNGTPPGGFVPYLRISAEIQNETKGKEHLRSFVDVTPHINLIDNFHYARNVSLPGKPEDRYSVTFNIVPPTEYDVALHSDWTREGYNPRVLQQQKFVYKNVNFKGIVDGVNTAILSKKDNHDNHH